MQMFQFNFLQIVMELFSQEPFQESALMFTCVSSLILKNFKALCRKIIELMS